MPEYSVIGKRLPRVDGIPKASGVAQYTADLSVPGQLYGKVLGSPYAHAKILNVDTSRAERLPGVRAVCTGKDLPGFKFGFMPTTRDEAPLNAEKVHFIGDAVAAVAAVDEDIAQEALSLIKVDYEVLPTVLDPEESMKPGAPQIHPEYKNNIGWEVHFNFGDADKGFAQSDYIQEDRFTTARCSHAFMEPHACIGQYDPSGKITMWASKQAPYFLYRVLSLAFNVPQHQVRVIQPYIGGGFGAKNDIFPLDIASVLLSKKTGRPVKIVYDQKWMLTTARRRSPMILYMKTGVKKDGTLMAQSLKAISDSGAYTTIAPITMWIMGAHMTFPYKLPSYKYDAYRVYTNKPASCAQRGHGLMHSRFASELQMDMIAQKLGLDPVEIRMKNAIDPGYVAVNGIKVNSCGFKECITEVAEEVNWKESYGKKERVGRIARGIGFAASNFASGIRMPFHNACAAIVKVNVDGTITLVKGATDCGQGSDTILCQMAAEELGLELKDVGTLLVDTDYTPIDPGSYSSRVTVYSGAAVKIAAEDARRQLAEVAAEVLKADAQNLVFKNHKVYDKTNPQKSIPFDRLTRIANNAGKLVMGQGIGNLPFDLPDIQKGIGNPMPAWAFAAVAAEVEVDTETGQVRVPRFTLAHDCGVAINPLSVEGQAQGAMAMGFGQTMTEDFLFDEAGHTLNPTFSDYKLPRAQEMPQMKLIEVPTVDPLTPYGAKEASEAPQVCVYPAIVSGIYNAIGVWIKDLPVTPEKILSALKEKEGK